MRLHPERTDVLPSHDASDQRDRLDRSLIHGIAWTGLAKWITQIISWIATPIVARLLSPADYGVASMAAVYIGLVQLVNEFGLGAAIVQRRDLSDEQISRLGGLSVLLSVCFFALSTFLASPIAGFFGNPEVGPVISVLSVTFLTSSFQALPRALLTRDLKFRRLATLDGLESVINIGVTLVLAALGFRYWALVIGALTSRVASTIAAVRWRGHRLGWPTQLKTIAAPIAFGFHFVIAGIAWYAFRNADLAIIGRRLGSVALGSYAIAATLASIPVDRLSALVTGPTLAIFATVQRDRIALRRYVLALTEGITLLTFPATVGLALVAEEFVLAVLGEPWRAAVTPLRLLSLVAAYRSVVPILNHVLIATGASKRNMQGALAISLVLPPLFYAGSQWGLEGVALVWLVAYPVVSLAFFVRYAFAACDMSLVLYVRALWPAASATIAMAAAVLMVGFFTPGAWSATLTLAARSAVGAATYVALIWFLHRGRVRSFLALARGQHSQDAASTIAGTP